MQNFFNAEECSRLRAEARSAAATAATIVRKDVHLVDESLRKTKDLIVSEASVSLTDRLQTLRPKVENHFQLSLCGCETPQFLLYRPGDFFGTHQDHNPELYSPKYVRDRLVSVVIFLSKQTEKPEEDSHCGGSLTFYGLIPEPKWEKYGFLLQNEEGLLIAFRSETFHEVQAVTSGERFSIVSWYC